VILSYAIEVDAEIYIVRCNFDTLEVDVALAFAAMMERVQEEGCVGK
jgi:hypothetical protein